MGKGLNNCISPSQRPSADSQFGHESPRQKVGTLSFKLMHVVKIWTITKSMNIIFRDKHTHYQS